MPRVLLLLLLFAAPALAHGGQYRGRGGGVPPGLPTQPSAPEASGGATHTWLTWWGYNQFRYMDFRRRQAARRGPVTGLREGEQEDPNAWRGGVRRELTPLMIEALADPDAEVRTAAAVALGKWRATLAIPDLQQLKEKDDQRAVREAAVLGLVLMRDPALRGYFQGLAEHPADDLESLRVRGFALLGIGLLGDEAAGAYLLALLDPGNAQARQCLPPGAKQKREFLCAAVAALTQVTGVDHTADFVRIAGDARLPEEVRAYAVSAIGKTGAKAALGTLLEICAKDPSDQMRRSAALALGAVATREDGEAIEALERRLKRDRDRITTHFAVISLGRIGGPRAYRMLAENYETANKEARGFYLIAFGLTGEPEAAARLQGVLERDADPVIRAAAALSLGLLDARAKVPAVREAFGGAKDWTLMQATMLSLALLDDQGSADAIRDVLVGKRQVAVRTAAAVSYALLRQWSALPVLVDVLKSARTIVTLSATAQVMGFLTSPHAAEPLVELYRDEHLQRQARAYALVAIGALGDPEPLPVFIRLAFDLNYFLRSDAVDEAVTIL